MFSLIYSVLSQCPIGIKFSEDKTKGREEIKEDFIVRVGNHVFWFGVNLLLARPFDVWGVSYQCVLSYKEMSPVQLST